MSNNSIEENSILNNNAQKELNFSKFKKFVLLEFTRQLIKHSMPSEVFELQTALEKEKKNRLERQRELIREIIRYKEKGLSNGEEKNLSTSAKEIKGGRTREIQSIVHPTIGMFETQKITHLNPFRESFISPTSRFNIPSKRIRLLIPESKFPLHIQYIKPVPINKEIELGKLDPLIKDFNVRIIECYGSGENLIVQGNMGVKRTGIILNKEEIEGIIQKFSKETKIPIQEGIFKVVAGKLIFLAIISEIVGSKFIIKKMINEQLPMYGM